MKNKAIFFIALATTLLVGCKGGNADSGNEGQDVSEYKAYFNEVRKEISGPDYYGRNGYGDGDVRAAIYIIDQIKQIKGLKTVKWMDPADEKEAHSEDLNDNLYPGDLGRITKYGSAKKYGPYLQNFKAPHNFFDGAMKLSFNGTELKNSDDYQVRSFSKGCHGTYKFAFLPKQKYNTSTLKECLESGEYTDTFVAIDPKDIEGPFWGTVNDVFKNLDTTKVSGIIQLSDYVKYRIGYSSVGVSFTTSVPVIKVKECKIPEGANEITVDIDQTMVPEHDSHNMSVFLPGTDKSLSDYFVCVAHYDHHGTTGVENILCGANDNASSSAMLLTLAKYFSKNRPARGIQFIWVDEEESGLYGSWYYTENPAMPLDKIKFLINFEQTADNGNSIWCGSNHEGDADLDRILAINGESENPFKITRVGFGDNSDHYSFGIKGVPVCYMATVGDSNSFCYHTPYDTYENSSDENFDRLFKMVVKYISE